MRAMSTETMQNIISYVDQYFCDKHTTPSVNEIALVFLKRLLFATWSKWTTVECSNTMANLVPFVLR